MIVFEMAANIYYSKQIDIHILSNNQIQIMGIQQDNNSRVPPCFKHACVDNGFYESFSRGTCIFGNISNTLSTWNHKEYICIFLSQFGQDKRCSTNKEYCVRQLKGIYTYWQEIIVLIPFININNS